jgi:hypothetical protein
MENKKETAKEQPGAVSVAQQFNNLNLDVFTQNSDFEDMTAGLIKLEAGEEILGFLLRESEFKQDKDGKDFEVVKIQTVKKDFSGDILPGELVFIAGQVIVGAKDKIFAKTDKPFIPVRILGKGEVKSAKGRTYLDYQVFAKFN